MPVANCVQLTQYKPHLLTAYSPQKSAFGLLFSGKLPFVFSRLIVCCQVRETVASPLQAPRSSQLQLEADGVDESSKEPRRPGMGEEKAPSASDSRQPLDSVMTQTTTTALEKLASVLLQENIDREEKLRGTELHQTLQDERLYHQSAQIDTANSHQVHV